MDFSKLLVKQDIFGKQLSYEDLKEFETVETFVDTHRDTRSIVKDKDGTYYLYDFHEEMGFPDDYLTEHFFLLENMEQGKTYATKDMLTLKTALRKYIWIGPGFEMKVVG